MNKFIPFSKTQKSIRRFALAILAWTLFALNVNAQPVNVPVTGFTYDIVANGVGATLTSGIQAVRYRHVLYQAVGQFRV